MTPKVRQLLDDLAADTTTAWGLYACGEVRTVIRAENGRHCPLSWLARCDPGDYHDAALVLDLDPVEANALVNAADNSQPDPALRSALLAACRLSEGAE